MTRDTPDADDSTDAESQPTATQRKQSATTTESEPTQPTVPGTTADDRDAYTADVLVIGSGIGGCAAALAAARAGADTALVTKASEPADAATDWAQGGISVTRFDPEAFAADIRAAGDGECDPAAVETLVDNARAAVESVLVETLGVPFDGDGDDLDHTREAGHSTRRILHVDAETGRHILRPFLAELAAHDRVRILSDTAAYDLLTHEGRVHGAVIETADERPAVPAYAGSTVLATGGIGALYRESTNPAGATGDGIAMAALAGADVTDMQYVQFHPTALDTAAVEGDAEPFLLSEAVRGEGGRLVNADCEPFMAERHPDGDLAPRDVVARAVAEERERTGEVRLDVSDVAFDERFPGLARQCRERGVDPAAGIPVVPAEHFLCGGVAVDDRGRASLDRLFAVGECARTGVHGANRLASTSLLEGLVWGLRAGETAAGHDPKPDAVEAPDLRDSDPALPANFAAGKFQRLQRVMTESFGLVRDRPSMRQSGAVLRRLKGEVDAYVRTRTSRELYELRNAAVTALLIARDAIEADSAGTHHVVGDGTTDAGDPSDDDETGEESRDAPEVTNQ